MKLEQLNKHEETSYIEDAEANEAILKNTVSMNDLCKYLSPLKFLEIETWRKEVPSGENVDMSKSEHRRWRTPVEILISSGKNEAETLSNDEDSDDVKEKALRKKRISSAFNINHQTFEDIQRQNALILKRSNSDVVKNGNNTDLVRPRIRDISSAVDRGHSKVQTVTSKKQNGRIVNIPEKYPSSKRTSATADKGGHILVNLERVAHPTRDAVLTSYFAPGRPVSPSRITEKNKNSSFRIGSKFPRPTTGASNYQSSGSLLRNSIFSASTNSRTRKISSSSWPAIAGADIKDDNEKEEVVCDVKVIPFKDYRPHASSEDRKPVFETGTSHPPVGLKSARRTDRGWRTWSNTRRRENRQNLPQEMYHTTAFANKAYLSTGVSTNKPNLGDSDDWKNSSYFNIKRPGGQNKMKDIEAKKSQGRCESSDSNENTIMRISYSLRRGNRIIISDVPKSDMDGTNTPLYAAESRNHAQTIGDAVAARNSLSDSSENNDIVNRVHTSDPNHRNCLDEQALKRTSTSPWTSDTFNSSLAENEGYYVRRQKPNKSVTFRLHQNRQTLRSSNAKVVDIIADGLPEYPTKRKLTKQLPRVSIPPSKYHEIDMLTYPNGKRMVNQFQAGNSGTRGNGKQGICVHRGYHPLLIEDCEAKL